MSVPSASARTSVTIPFDASAKQVAVEATVRGKPLTFIIDTAVTPSVIDHSVAKALGLSASDAPSGEASGTGGGSAAVFPAELRDVQLGALKVHQVDAVAFDMTPLSRKFGRPLHGILGESFLRSRILVIDYGRQRLTFFASASEAHRSVARCAVRHIQRLIFVPGDVAPRLSISIATSGVPVSLDTGSALGLELYDGALPASQEARLLADREETTVTGARGAAAVEEAVLRGTVRLGPFRWAHPKIVLSGKKGSAATRLGNLGNGFLQGKTLLLDYRGKTLGLYERCGGRTPQLRAPVSRSR